jgi:hypothetical protein
VLALLMLYASGMQFAAVVCALAFVLVSRQQ